MNRFFLSFAGLLLTVQCGYANISALRSLSDLEQNADLIVVGTASGTAQSGHGISFAINVNRVVKGDPTMAGQKIPVYWISASIMAPLGPEIPGYLPASIPIHFDTELTARGSGLWFLQQRDSEWMLYPVQNGASILNNAFFPAPSGPIMSAYTYGPTASLDDRLASEVSSAIEGADSALSLQLLQLQYGPLDDVKSPVFQVLYQRLSTSSATRQRILGLGGLIRRGSSAALISATKSEADFAGYAMENGILIQSIRSEFRSSDGNSVAALGAAATNPDLNSSFREATGHALRSIHTAATLPFLAALLDDPIAAMRVEGIGGLAAFANNLPMQTSASEASLAHLQMNGRSGPYRTEETIRNFAQGPIAILQNESKYLSFWKSWWSQNRASLGY